MIIILSNKIINSIAINIKSILESITNVKIIYELTNDDLSNDDLYIILFNINSKMPKIYIYYQTEQLNYPYLKKNNFALNAVKTWELCIYNTIFYNRNIDLSKVYYCPLPFYNTNIMFNNKIKYDILFYGILNERRNEILHLVKKKYKIKIINCVYGDKLFKYISKSKIILNLHYYNGVFLETCRINEVLNYNKIVISENPHIYDYQNKKLYSNMVVFFDVIKKDLSNINAMYDLIDYYLITNNYNNFTNSFDKNKIYLQNITKNILLKNLNIEIKIKYYPNDNLFQYLKYSNKLLPYKYVLKKIEPIIYFDNCFNVDVDFYKYINNINLDFNSTLKHISEYGISNGLIYHPKQINNLYPELQIYFYKKQYYIEAIELKEFVENNIYNKTFENFMEDLIDIEYSNITDSELLILVFIGGETIGIKLLDKIINFNKKYCIGFCFNNYQIYLKLKNTIMGNFNNCCVSISKNYGNDIIPTLQLYWYLNKNIKFEYVIKTHTKSDEQWFNELNDYLFADKYETNNNCNCIGNPEYYLDINDDKTFESKTLIYFTAGTLLNDTIFIVYKYFTVLLIQSISVIAVKIWVHPSRIIYY